MISPFSFRAWLFDLDGTLVSTTDAVMECMKGIILELGGTVPEGSELARAFGSGFEAVMGPWVPQGKLEEALELYLSRFHAEVAPKVRFLPGAEALLRYLHSRNIPLAIVTGAKLREVEEVSRIVGLDAFVPFSNIVHVDSIPFRKPSPEPVLEACRLIGQRPGRDIVFVGDSEHDVRSGKLAGVFSVGILGGSSSEELLRSAGPDVVFSGMQELYERVR